MPGANINDPNLRKVSANEKKKLAFETKKRATKAGSEFDYSTLDRKERSGPRNISRNYQPQQNIPPRPGTRNSRNPRGGYAGGKQKKMSRGGYPGGKQKNMSRGGRQAMPSQNQSQNATMQQIEDQMRQMAEESGVSVDSNQEGNEGNNFVKWMKDNKITATAIGIAVLGAAGFGIWKATQKK